jgi:malonate-semialdehyde dehydrogenase (acetylating)/methylmalonate-semialdehyde dehydrogenase
MKWAATNPQRRARVMMKFVELLHRDMDKLAEALSREHGKTIPDAKGDVQRGLEVAEFCIGAPHLLKGEFTEGAGPGIDMYSLRQPLGVVAGITPFNFPAMIPMWKFCPAIACGNAFILKPSERDPLRAADAGRTDEEAGLPDGRAQCRQWRQGSGRRDPRPSRTIRHRLRRLDPDRAICLRAAAPTASACSASAAPRTT